MEYRADDQYRIMWRAFLELYRLAMNSGEDAVLGPDATDAARTFFIECYTFKDYLKKDGRISKPKDVEDHVSTSRALSLAADLCNSLKHAGLDGPSRSGQTLDKINLRTTLRMPAGKPHGTAIGRLVGTKNPSDGDQLVLKTIFGLKKPFASSEVVLTISGKEYDAVSLARECVRDWDAFLASRGLGFDKNEK